MLLIAGALYIRSLIADSFYRAGYVDATRQMAYGALRYMLDEETGVRGYAATGSKILLQPYFEAKAPFLTSMQGLTDHVKGPNLVSVSGYVADMYVTNALWNREVGDPLIANPHSAGTLAIELRGKALVDRFRDDVRRVNDRIQARETAINETGERNIDRIGLLIGVTVLVILGIAVVFARQQAKLAIRIEEQRVLAESKAREAEILTAAYQAEKRIADTLQEAFVQRPLPTHPTFRFSATYVPATEETKVGGDWYDALELPNNRVLFAIGDVTGHGIEAAVTMNRVRQSLISSALLDPDPAALLQRVGDELFYDKTPLVTAVAGFADASTFEFVYASAGHPPPLLIEPGREPRFLSFGSLPLGAMAETEYRTFRIQSVPGAILVLYTDGAIEHTRDVIEGEAILLAAASEAAKASSTEPATTIHNAVFNGRDVGDDVAILTIGFAAEPASGMTISVDNKASAFSGRILSPTVTNASSISSLRSLRRWFGQRAA